MIALRQSGKNYDYSKYADALERYIDTDKTASATSRQKYALAMLAAGRADSPFIASTLRDTVGEQGIMSWVYGLHLLNNGVASDGFTVAEVVDKLLSMKLADGGWALTGEHADVDVTAMTVQALAPYYNSDENVRAAVDGALDLLSAKQNDGGDYSSYGMLNSESTAQVITALSSLGIDSAADTRFIKNDNTLFDGMLQYKLGNGSFSHKSGGAYSHIATVQVYSALVSYMRCLDSRGSLYIIDKNVTEPSSETDAENNSAPDRNISKTVNYKYWAVLAVAVIAVNVCIILFIMGRHQPKNFIFVLMVAAVVIAVIFFTDFRSASDYYNGGGESKKDIIGSVTLTIRCDKILGLDKPEKFQSSDYLPSDGIILDATSFDITEGDTAFSILAEAARKNKMQMENKGSVSGANGMAYIKGINYLYEFDYGDLSGWIYRVNGVQPSVSCGEYTLSDGDMVEWLYTLDLGNDYK